MNKIRANRPARLPHILGAILALAAYLTPVHVSAALDWASSPNLWDLAKSYGSIHQYSTLITAQDVRDRLSSDAGIESALDWCRKTGVRKVYVESYRDAYQAEAPALIKIRDRFRAAGFTVSGCITPTLVGKKSNGWQGISCYTDPPTQDRIQAIFEFTAPLFDEIMIDDFWFTDCTCADCQAARKSKTVQVGSKTYAVGGNTWEDYRCELMVRVSQDRLLAPSKRLNPKVRLIIKYPQWYENFHERGYEVARETSDFDLIWVGTEARDYGDRHWGGTPQFESYFIMRWLGGIGGAKCGGGWYDWLGTTERTYIEQARLTILGGARESMLFCYGGLQGSTGPKNIPALRSNLPELLEVAKEVRAREPFGLAAYKPANSHPGPEPRVFDFIGMLGLPLVPCHEFPTDAPAAFFSVHALKDLQFPAKLERFIAAGKPVLITDGLAKELKGKLALDKPNVVQIAVKGEPKSLLTLSSDAADELRAPLLRPFDATLKAPNKVALFLFRDGSWVIENFNDDPVEVNWKGQPITIEARGWKYHWIKP